MSILLSGCFSPPNQLVGPAAVKVDRGTLQVAVCREIVAVELLALTWGDNEDEFWIAEGSVTIPRGTVLTAATLGSFFSTVERAGEPIVGQGSVMEVIITSDQAADNIVASFDFRDLPLQRSQWSHPDGSFSDEPCP